MEETNAGKTLKFAHIIISHKLIFKDHIYFMLMIEYLMVVVSDVTRYEWISSFEGLYSRQGISVVFYLEGKSFVLLL